MNASDQELSIDQQALYFPSRADWRSWLQLHHKTETAVWIRIHKGIKNALTLHEAQEESLCFGWVDVKNKRIDNTFYALKFTPRRPQSDWSISNIVLVEKLIEAGRMTQAGLVCVNEAKSNGIWNAGIESAKTHIIPADLKQALQSSPNAFQGYAKMKDGRKRQLLYLLYTAKHAATRVRRVAAIVAEALDAYGDQHLDNQPIPNERSE